MKKTAAFVLFLLATLGLAGCSSGGESDDGNGGPVGTNPPPPGSPPPPPSPSSDNTAPVVSLSAPSAGSIVEGQVNISASATDASGVLSVTFLVNGSMLAEDFDAPFTASWNPQPGDYTLTALAVDNSSNRNEGTVTINVTAVEAQQPGPPPPPAGDAPSIAAMGMHEVNHGDVFVYDPLITGDIVMCRKDLGHDDVTVDSETGRIVWDTSGLEFGRGFHVRIKCSNYAGAGYASMVVHVDKSGTSRLRVAGQDGVSPYVGVAGRAMNSGDTIVFPDGVYPVSVSGNESYENAFKTNSPTSGSNDQFSTLIAESPGGVLISGAPRNGIPKQKNAFQLAAVSRVAIVGMVVKDIRRESFTAEAGADRLLIDFLGTAGAGTNGEPCSNFSEAGNGWCSKAGLRVNGGTPLIQHSYDWGQNRYGIMTRSTSGSVTRRSFVRLDEHRGDQPYGGFSDYCDSAHLSQDNTVFDSLAIAAPFYKNYAGLSAFPATGCENMSSDLKTAGLLAVNNDLSLSLMDSKAGPAHIWEYIVSYDSEGTCTPQTNQCGNWLLQADKQAIVSNSFFGQARGFQGSTSGAAFGNAVTLESSVTIDDVPGVSDRGQRPEYLPESLLYYRGRADTFFGDPGYDSPTTVRRWPIGGEDIIAANMRSYSNPSAFAVGGGTVNIDGDRGGAASNETLSEYFWGMLNDQIPPLAVRVKAKATFNRVAWEHHSSWRRTLVTGWKVICVSSGNSELASLPENQLQFNDTSGCTDYGIRALYGNGESGIAYIESPE